MIHWIIIGWLIYQFEKTNKSDCIKNEYCKDNKISILCIPYIYNPITDKQKIEEFVLDFIKMKQVPQEVLNYYNQFEFSNYTKCVTELNEKIIN